MKRFSLITLFSLTITLSAFAFQDPDPQYSNLEFTVLDAEAKTVSVKGINNASTNPIIIPSIATDGVDDYTVTTIAEKGFYQYKYITKIVLPEGLTTIKDRAFAHCTGIKDTIILPSTLTTLYSFATFYNVPTPAFIVKATTPPTISVSETYGLLPDIPISIPDGTRDKYNNAYEWSKYKLMFCDSQVFTDGKFIYQVLPEDSKTVSIKAKSIDDYQPEDILEIPSSAQNPFSRENYTVTTIAASGFYDASRNNDKGIKIKQIIFPSTIKTIGETAFREITTPFTIELNEGLIEIGDRAFCRSTGLTGNIVLPSSLQNIGSSATFLETHIDSIIIKAIVPPTILKNEADYPLPNVPMLVPCNTLRDYVSKWSAYKPYLIDPCLTLIDNIYYLATDTGAVVDGYDSTPIGDLSFRESVTFGNQALAVVAIAESRFSNTQITSLTLPATLKTIGKASFRDNKSLKTLILNEGLQTIGDKAFAHDSSIVGTLVLPASLKYIGEKVFYNLLHLDTLSILSVTPPTLLDNATQTSNTISDVFYDLPLSTVIQVPCNTLRTYRNHARWSPFADRYVDSCLVLIDNIYYLATDTGAVVDGYDSAPIGELSFRESVTFGVQTLAVVAIAESRFSNTQITSLTLPATLKTIGKASFRDNKSLKTLILNEGLKTIGERSFTNDSSICGNLHIPASIKEIGSAAFYGAKQIDTVIFSSMTAPSTTKIAYVQYDSIFGGNNHTAFSIPCGAMDNYKNAYYWKDLSSRFVSACKPLMIRDGEALTNDTIVSEIQYVRIFNDDLWQVLYLPFAVEKVTIYDEKDKQDYELSPWNSDSGGNYYLAEHTGFSNNRPVYEVATNLEKGKYYLIKFLDKGYYHGKDIVFTSEKGELHLTKDFSATSKSTSYQMCGNNTLFKQSVGDGFLFSKQDTDFIYTQNAEILPFEYYVVPLQPSSGNSAPSLLRLSARIGRQADTPTNIRQTSTGAIYLYNGEQLTLYPQKKEMYIYAVNGMLLHHIPAGQTESTVNLQSGAYIVVSENNSQKILL